MTEFINTFRKDVISLASDPKFVHYSWYVKYHLEIVEKIAIEVCNIYKAADKYLVIALVWLHDYGKIINYTPEATIVEIKNNLSKIGFTESFIELAVSYLTLIDKRENIAKTPIEVQIVSSADGASHLTGPFQFLWWYENYNKPFEELMEDNIRKIRQDWEKKIVIPEVCEAFKKRRDFMLELSGKFPINFVHNSDGNK